MDIKSLDEVAQSYVSSMPVVVFKLQEALLDEDMGFNEIGEIISGDPALVARLLKIVNSPFFGLESEVDTISHALSIVGVTDLHDLIISSVVVQQFKDLSEEFVSINSFWKHNIATGVIAREIATLIQDPKPERFYLSGMLHDLGSLVIFNCLPDASEEVIAKCRENNTSLYEEENKVMGFNHTDVGSRLLNAWKLPESIIAAAANHHEPFQGKGFSFEGGVIHLADSIAHILEMGESGEPYIPMMYKSVLDKLDLEENFWEPIEEKIRELYDGAVSSYL
jgi:HD-like signal output (HDOD) protein